MTIPDYALLDFGRGRKLERFGPFVLDRPSPAAEGFEQAHPQRWREAEGRFELSPNGNERGRWHFPDPLPAGWPLHCEELVLQVRTTPFGHTGVFPEQMPNWRWLTEQTAAAAEPMKLLNLFGYTGGSTLAAAAGLRRHGGEAPAVVHVDSSAAAVKWARRNAEISKLGEAPIRWIVEDAPRFVARERKRGNRYDGLILDPPSFGHGPKGEIWRLEEHLPSLLAECLALTAGTCRLLLLTCHSPGWGPAELADLVREVWPKRTQLPPLEFGELTLTTDDGRVLPSGAMVRFASS